MQDPRDKLKAVQPGAIEIRSAGMCEICQRPTLVSYTLAQYADVHPNPRKQYCGYFCLSCGFSAAGDREFILRRKI